MVYLLSINLIPRRSFELILSFIIGILSMP
jgi:hypothetical protein